MRADAGANIEGIEAALTYVPEHAPAASRRGGRGPMHVNYLVANLIRGKDVGQAEAILKYTDKRSSAPILKLLQSARANACASTGSPRRVPVP